jgi:hypothetical protein
MAVSNKISLCWGVTSYRFLDQHFGEICCRHLLYRRRQLKTPEHWYKMQVNETPYNVRLNLLQKNPLLL